MSDEREQGVYPLAGHGGARAYEPAVQGDSRLPAYMSEEPPYGYVGAQEEFNLWKYIDIISRRRWSIAACLVVCILTGSIITFAATPMYRSTALLQIQPNGPNVLSFEDVQESIGQSQAYQDFFQTQYAILNSRTLAKRTIDKLGLESNADFNPELMPPSLPVRLKNWVVGMIMPAGEVDPQRAELERQHKMMDAFLSEVEVQPRRKSFLVEWSFSSPDAVLAKQIAATAAHEYIDLTLDQRIDSASQGRGFIEKQLSITKARLEQSEQDLQEFARSRDIVALEQEEKVIHERLADLNNRLTAAQGARIEHQAMYEQSRTADRYSLQIIVSSPLIKSLKEQMTDLEVALAQLSNTFTDEYPEVRKLKARIRILDIRMRAEEDRLLASVKSDYEAALKRESMLKEELERQRELVASYEVKAIDFKIMRRDVDINRGIYENLLQRLKEVEVTEAVRASNITIVDQPEVPLDPDRPNIPVNLAFSMLLGLFSGLGLAVAQEYLDDSVKTPEDVEKALRLPTLAAIPEFKALDDLSLDQEVALQPTSAGSEAIRTLRAALFLTAPGGFPKRLIVTSSRPGEGKTCIASNLSIALAQMGRKVVLLDCDLRRPRAHQALGAAQAPGVSNYLVGNMGSAEIIRETAHKGLDLISAGPVPPSPVDLLDSEAMSRLLEELDARYDNVIVDAPPALMFADVPVLTARLGGGCLLIACSGETPTRVLKRASESLIRMQSKMLGVVLNRVSQRSAGYSYYGYYGGYGDYYGSGAEKLQPPQSPPPTGPAA